MCYVIFRARVRVRVSVGVRVRVGLGVSLFQVVVLTIQYIILSVNQSCVSVYIHVVRSAIESCCANAKCLFRLQVTHDAAPRATATLAMAF